MASHRVNKCHFIVLPDSTQNVLMVECKCCKDNFSPSLCEADGSKKSSVKDDSVDWALCYNCTCWYHLECLLIHALLFALFMQKHELIPWHCPSCHLELYMMDT